jgi:hypothetical protein
MVTRLRTRLWAVDVVSLATLVSLLTGSCSVAGCASAGKLSPEQIQSVQALAEVATKAAQDNNVVVQARVRLTTPEFYAKQSVGVDGIEAEVYFTANPADNDQTKPSTTPNE